MVRPKTGQKYVYSILVDEETYKKILWNRRYHEPMGSVVHRLISQRQSETDSIHTRTTQVH